MTPDDIDVWVGLDVGKSAHHAHALDHDGNTLYDKPLKQDEKAIRTMLGKLSKHGRVLLVPSTSLKEAITLPTPASTAA